MNIDVKIATKYLHIESKTLSAMIKFASIPEVRNGSTYVNIISINLIDHKNKLQSKKHMIISLDTEKASDKIQDSIMKNSWRN